MAEQLTAADLRASGLIPEGYVVLPVSLVEELIRAGFAVYEPAVGGSDEAADRIRNAARAASNVVDRYKRGSSDVGQEEEA